MQDAPLLSECNDCHTCLAFTVPAQAEAADARMSAQTILNARPQYAGSIAVDDADLIEG